MPWDGVGGIIAVNTVLSSADAWLTNSGVTALGDITVNAEHVAQIDASATSRIEAWDAQEPRRRVQRDRLDPANIFFSPPTRYRRLRLPLRLDVERRPATLEPATWSGSTAASSPARSSSTSARSRARRPDAGCQDYDDTCAGRTPRRGHRPPRLHEPRATPSLAGGKRVLVPGGTHGLKYVGPATTTSTDLSPLVHGLLDIDHWINMTPVFAGQRPSHAQALVIDSPLTSPADISVTATSGAQLNAMVGNDNVVEAALDLLFVSAQTRRRRRRRARTRRRSPRRSRPRARRTRRRRPKRRRRPRRARRPDGRRRATARAARPAASSSPRTRPRASPAPRSCSPRGAGHGRRRRRRDRPAQDTAGIDSHSSVVQDVVTTNDLTGLVPIVDSVLLPDDYKYTTASGSQTLRPATGSGSARRTPARRNRRRRLPVPRQPRDDLHRVELRDADVDDLPERHRAAAARAGTALGQAGRDVHVHRQRAAATSIDINNANYDRHDPVAAGAHQPRRRGLHRHRRLEAARRAAPPPNLENLYPGIGNFTNSDARAIGILIVLNDVRSDVTCTRSRTAGSVHVRRSRTRCSSRTRRSTSTPRAAASTARRRAAANGQLIKHRPRGATAISAALKRRRRLRRGPRTSS